MAVRRAAPQVRRRAPPVARLVQAHHRRVLAHPRPRVAPHRHPLVVLARPQAAGEAVAHQAKFTWLR